MAWPALFIAVIIKLAVPLKLTLETVSLPPENSKATGVRSRITEIPSLLVMFSMVALIEARQFSSVTGEVAGALMVMVGASSTGRCTSGHGPWVSPCAW